MNVPVFDMCSSAAYLSSIDLSTVQCRDGVAEVVRLIDNNDLILQFDPGGLASSGMKEGLIWQHHHLRKRERVRNNQWNSGLQHNLSHSICKLF